MALWGPNCIRKSLIIIRLFSQGGGGQHRQRGKTRENQQELKSKPDCDSEAIKM